MPTRTCALRQVTGGLMWSAGLVLGGYALGSSLPNVNQHLLSLGCLIVVAPLLPLPLELLRSLRHGRAATKPARRHAA
ncbi:hypothetical protein AB0N17_44510 [Streptomyces sp. NPDC051133]|uniref:hypothetical protein n=1 Tax=Streptomyces sp. NPDC051133 TaxID=3155521 RepID=UPI0034361DA9